MKVSDAATSLKLVNEFPGYERNEWSLEELFQREVDWDRVLHQIVKYLKTPDHPQFFNSMTVALLPRTGEEHLVSYDHEDLIAPSIKPDFGATAKTLSVGPLSVGYWADWPDGHFDHPMAQFGTLRWNPKQAFSVAIDGQHRLAALKELADTSDDWVDSTSVPVIILVFDPRVGFQAPSDTDSHLPLLRALFIDLNKHAVKVSRSRLILLDDRDPTALCVRELVGNKLTDGLAELEVSPPTLPLTLVDWHSDSAKFDEGPYVTTILGIDWIVQHAVGIKPVADYTNYSAIRRQIRDLQRLLDVDLSSAEERLKAAEDVQKPFSYGDGTGALPDELALISEGFGSAWNAALVTIFTLFRPYSEIISLRADLNTTNPLFVQWYQLQSQVDGATNARVLKSYERLQSRLNEAAHTSVARLEEALDDLTREKGHSLAFNVAFQRALLLAFKDFRVLDDDDLGGSPHDAEFEHDELEDYFGPLEEEDSDIAETPASTEEDTVHENAIRAEQFVTALNDVLGTWPEFLDVRTSCTLVDSDEPIRFWLGTLLKDTAIDYTKGASNRASYWLGAAAYLRVMLAQGKFTAASSFEDFWDELYADSPSPAYDDALSKRLRMQIKRLHSSNAASKGTAERILGEEAQEAALLSVIRNRCKQLFLTIQTLGS